MAKNAIVFLKRANAIASVLTGRLKLTPIWKTLRYWKKPTSKSFLYPHRNFHSSRVLHKYWFAFTDGSISGRYLYWRFSCTYSVSTCEHVIKPIPGVLKRCNNTTGMNVLQYVNPIDIFTC